LPARRFNQSATPIVDYPAKQYNQLTPVQRGVNMDGTAVLLPIRPPHYEPRVLIAGGTSRGANWVSGELGALKSVEWIDLSVATPAWQALPDMNVARDKVNSVPLPDGRILILGGVEMPPDGGPVEIFDPEDPTSGFQLGTNMKYPRGYHSAAILLPDGSVIVGGDPNGGTTPNERYLRTWSSRARWLRLAGHGRPRGSILGKHAHSRCYRGGRAHEARRGNPCLQSQPTIRWLRHLRTHSHDGRRDDAGRWQYHSAGLLSALPR
jgi:hypothetical protein